jgi:hypothetical protein
MRDAPVVVCSEVPNNPGGSITNSAGAIAAGVIEANELITPLVWIEHWPEETTGRAEETLDIVVFSNYEVVERAPYLRETRTWIGDATWKPLGFSEDEIRRPTLNAVPYGFAKALYGLLRPGRRIGPPWMVAKTNRRGQPGSISATNAPTCASSTHKAVRLWKRAGCAPPRSSKATVLLRAAAAASRHRGGHSPWVSRVLEECGHEVMVANPRKVRLIYTNKSVGPPGSTVQARLRQRLIRKQALQRCHKSVRRDQFFGPAIHVGIPRPSPTLSTDRGCQFVLLAMVLRAIYRHAGGRESDVSGSESGGIGFTTGPHSYPVILYKNSDMRYYACYSIALISYLLGQTKDTERHVNEAKDIQVNLNIKPELERLLKDDVEVLQEEQQWSKEDANQFKEMCLTQ